MLVIKVPCARCGTDNEFTLQNLGVGTTSRPCAACTRLMRIEFKGGRVCRICPEPGILACGAGSPFEVVEIPDNPWESLLSRWSQPLPGTR